MISYHLYSSTGSFDISVSGGLHYLISSCSHEVISVDNRTFINPDIKYIMQHFLLVA